MNPEFHITRKIETPPDLPRYVFHLQDGRMLPVYALDLLIALGWARFRGIDWLYISERYEDQES